jgi:hypothetical protein
VDEDAAATIAAVVVETASPGADEVVGTFEAVDEAMATLEVIEEEGGDTIAVVTEAEVAIEEASVVAIEEASVVEIEEAFVVAIGEAFAVAEVDSKDQKCSGMCLGD